MDNRYLIYTDGGSRGNPGPAALGVVIEGNVTGRKEYGEYLGEKTNNFAEYSAVVFALKKLKSLIGGEKAKVGKVEIHADSELLVKQLNGEYKVKDEGMQKLFFEIWNLKLDFGEVIFRHIPREENHGADAVVNKVLDAKLNKLDL